MPPVCVLEGVEEWNTTTLFKFQRIATKSFKFQRYVILPTWTELSRKYLGKDKSVFRGWCETAPMTSQRSYWCDVAIHSDVMALCFEQQKRH